MAQLALRGMGTLVALALSVVACGKTEDSQQGKTGGASGSGDAGGSSGARGGTGGSGGAGGASGGSGTGGTGGAGTGGDGSGGTSSGATGGGGSGGGSGGSSGGGGTSWGCVVNDIISSTDFRNLVERKCRIIETHLIITPWEPVDGIPSLEGLETITEIRGRLQISSFDGTSLKGLENLTRIGTTSIQGFRLDYNPNLESLEHLRNLRSIAGSLSIVGGTGSLKGLENLESVGGVFVQNSLYTLGPLLKWPAATLRPVDTQHPPPLIRIFDTGVPQCEVELFDAQQTDPGATCLDAQGVSVCTGNDDTATCQ